jgi:hypothetical protein
MTDERVAEPPDEAGTTAGGGRPLQVSPIIVLEGPPDAVDKVAGPSSAQDGVVLYGGDQRTLWSSRTDGHDGAVLVLQADGDLTIVQGGRTLWATGTGT